MTTRRTFVKSAVGFVGACQLGLRPVSAAEATLPEGSVQFAQDMEPLVRLIEDSPRDQLMEEMARRVQDGLSYRRLLAALQLAGCAMSSHALRWALSSTRCWSSIPRTWQVWHRPTRTAGCQSFGL